MTRPENLSVPSHIVTTSHITMAVLCCLVDPSEQHSLCFKCVKSSSRILHDPVSNHPVSSRQTSTLAGFWALEVMAVVWMVQSNTDYAGPLAPLSLKRLQPAKGLLNVVPATPELSG